MADIITGIRTLCSIALLFFPVFSPTFYTLYIVAGVSDMIDGTVARKTGTVSKFGAKLDVGSFSDTGSPCDLRNMDLFRRSHPITRSVRSGLERVRKELRTRLL